ncbi:MAG: biotin transporter BioY [Candidatus Bathyarchaeota archaeon]
MLRALDVALIALFAALTSVGAFISIPMFPVPITLQTFFILLAGVILGKRLGALSQILYTLLGVVGLPIFARGTAGFGVLIGPTGGYLIGFVVGVFVLGALVEFRERQRGKVGFWWTALSMVIATVIIYALGVVHLHFVLNTFLGVNVTWLGAITLGVLPFLVGDALKILVASYICNSKQIKTMRTIILGAVQNRIKKQVD